MPHRKPPAKVVELSKEAARLGRRLERKGPFRPRTFEVDEKILQQFLAEVERRDIRQKDAISDALELWLKT